MANIQKFLDSFVRTEAARSSNFEVFIKPPNSLLVPYAGYGSTLRFRCEVAELPARTFSTVDQKTYGPVQTFPVQNFFDKINLVFICSDTMAEKKFFDSWMDYISVATRRATNSPSRLLFDFEYRTSYETQITINQYDLQGKISHSVKLLECYPIAVNTLSLSWDAVDTIQKLPVTICYRYFEST